MQTAQPLPDLPPERRKHIAPPEVRLSDKTVQYLEERIAVGVSNGLKAAMTKETAAAFLGAAVAVMQEQATEHAGRFVLGGLWGAVRKLAMFFTLGGIVYALGGWSALAVFFKALFAR